MNREEFLQKYLGKEFVCGNRAIIYKIYPSGSLTHVKLSWVDPYDGEERSVNYTWSSLYDHFKEPSTWKIIDRRKEKLERILKWK